MTPPAASPARVLASARPSFPTLPPELHLQIAAHLPYPDLIQLQRTARYFFATLAALAGLTPLEQLALSSGRGPRCADSGMRCRNCEGWDWAERCFSVEDRMGNDVANGVAQGEAGRGEDDSGTGPRKGNRGDGRRRGRGGGRGSGEMDWRGQMGKSATDEDLEKSVRGQPQGRGRGRGRGRGHDRGRANPRWRSKGARDNHGDWPG